MARSLAPGTLGTRPRRSSAVAEVDELFASDGTCRFDRVVIGGGDHIYEVAVRRLGDANADTVVVSRAESLAARLRLAADEIVMLCG